MTAAHAVPSAAGRHPELRRDDDYQRGQDEEAPELVDQALHRRLAPRVERGGRDEGDRDEEDEGVHRRRLPAAAAYSLLRVVVVVVVRRCRLVVRRVVAAAARHVDAKDRTGRKKSSFFSEYKLVSLALVC